MYTFKTKELKKVTKREEYDAIYRFRFQVYVNHLGRDHHIADHKRKVLIYPRDENDPDTELYYVGHVNNIKAVLRMDYFTKKDMPEELSALKLDNFDFDDDDVLSYGSKLMVKPELSGLLKMPSMIGEGFEYMVYAKNVKQAFCSCNPGLIKFYKQFGWEVYSQTISPSGFTALILTISREKMLAFVKRDRGKLSLLYHYLFEKKQKSINLKEEIVIIDKKVIFEKIKIMHLEKTNAFFSALSLQTIKDLSSFSYLMHVKANNEIVRTGLMEKEIYIIIDGHFNVVMENGHVIKIGPGQIFGEVAFFLKSGKRSASIYSTEESNVLVLLRSAITKIAKKNCQSAFEITYEIGKIMASRFDYCMKLTMKTTSK
ncbi:long chain N-acylphenylalanine synthase [Candidatus Magnetomorum sp. HK-1]|nr:long chain N-acylphenylalanine synthase [Candidatus Magnetomorum sp. HK-1]